MKTSQQFFGCLLNEEQGFQGTATNVLEPEFDVIYLFKNNTIWNLFTLQHKVFIVPSSKKKLDE